MDMILKNTFQSISPAYEPIGDVTVEGTAKTQVDFNGLSIGKDDELLLVSNTKNPSGWEGSYNNLFINDNGTSSNYYVQNLRAYSTTFAGSRVNGSNYNYTEYSQWSSTFTKIKLTNSGYVAYQSSTLLALGGSMPQIWDMYGTSTFTTTGITKLSIVNTVAGNIGIGSRFQLYKLVAEKVADIIVPSNTTSVDITGLDIGKDGEYYLVSNIIASSQFAEYYLYPNGKSTKTDYWNQRLYAQATTVGSSRDNYPAFASAYTTDNSFNTATIKLTNSGYFVYQANESRRIGTSSIELFKRYGTSNTTESVITSLSVVGGSSTTIGANSRFTLYKMK